MNKLIILLLPVLVSYGCSSSLKTENAPIIQIEISNGWSKISTFQHLFTQDPGTGEEASIPFDLTPEEQLKILRIVDSVNFWQIPEDSLRYATSLKSLDSIASPTKYPDAGPETMRIKTKDHDKKLTMIWWENYDFSSSIPVISNAVFEMVRERPEYKKIPTARSKW